MLAAVMDEWEWWNELEGEELERNVWGWPHYDVEEVADFIEEHATIEDFVLDIGCGPGRLGHVLARRNPHVEFIGTDIAWNMLGLAAKNAPNNWTVQWSDGTSIPDCTFNTVYAVTVFQHLPPDVVQSYIQQAHDQLVEDGTLIFTYATGYETAPRSYQTTHSDVTQSLYSAGFSQINLLTRPSSHPNWNWASAKK